MALFGFFFCRCGCCIGPSTIRRVFCLCPDHQLLPPSVDIPFTQWGGGTNLAFAVNPNEQNRYHGKNKSTGWPPAPKPTASAVSVINDIPDNAPGVERQNRRASRAGNRGGLQATEERGPNENIGFLNEGDSDKRVGYTRNYPLLNKRDFGKRPKIPQPSSF